MMYLAFFRFLMATKTYVFLNLNHEAVVTKLNIATVVIILADTLAGLLYKGTTCNVKVAMVFLALIGVTENIEDFPNDVIEDPITLIVMNLVITVAVILYILSSVVLIKYKLPSTREVIVNPTGNNIPLDSMPTSIPVPHLIVVSPYQPSTSNMPFVGVDEATTTNLQPEIVEVGEIVIIPITGSQTTRVINDEEPQLTGGDEVLKPDLANTRTPSIETDEEVIQIPPPEAPQLNPVPSSPLSNSEAQFPLIKLFQKIPFSVGIVTFFIVFTTPFVNGSNAIFAVIVDKGIKYVLACAPMYWVLMVDDVFTFSLRKTRIWLADNFQVYFD